MLRPLLYAVSDFQAPISIQAYRTEPMQLKIDEVIVPCLIQRDYKSPRHGWSEEEKKNYKHRFMRHIIKKASNQYRTLFEIGWCAFVCIISLFPTQFPTDFVLHVSTVCVGVFLYNVHSIHSSQCIFVSFILCAQLA